MQIFYNICALSFFQFFLGVEMSISKNFFSAIDVLYDGAQNKRKCTEFKDVEFTEEKTLSTTIQRPTLAGWIFVT